MPLTYNNQPIIEFGNFSPSKNNAGDSITGTILIDRITFVDATNNSYITVSDSAMACNSANTATSNVTEINFPGTIAYIGDYAFNYCSKLINVGGLPALKEVGTNGFSNCSQLSLNLDDCPNLEQVGVTAFGWSNVSATALPSKLTKVSNWAFGNCRNVAISDFTSVQTIGSSAFNSQNLNNSGNGVTKIEFNASSVRTESGEVQSSVFTNYGYGTLNTIKINYQGSAEFSTEEKSTLGLSSVGITWEDDIVREEG